MLIILACHQCLSFGSTMHSTEGTRFIWPITDVNWVALSSEPWPSSWGMFSVCCDVSGGLNLLIQCKSPYIDSFQPACLISSCSANTLFVSYVGLLYTQWYYETYGLKPCMSLGLAKIWLLESVQSLTQSTIYQLPVLIQPIWVIHLCGLLHNPLNFLLDQYMY